MPTCTRAGLKPELLHRDSIGIREGHDGLCQRTEEHLAFIGGARYQPGDAAVGLLERLKNPGRGWEYPRAFVGEGVEGDKQEMERGQQLADRARLIPERCQRQIG
jgi:hypothetical protein